MDTPQFFRNMVGVVMERVTMDQGIKKLSRSEKSDERVIPTAKERYEIERSHDMEWGSKNWIF